MPAKTKVVVPPSAQPPSTSAKPAAAGKSAKSATPAAVKPQTVPAEKKAPSSIPHSPKAAKTGVKTTTAPPATVAVKAKSASTAPVTKGKNTPPPAAQNTPQAAPCALKEKSSAKKSAASAKAETPAAAKAETTTPAADAPVEPAAAKPAAKAAKPSAKSGKTAAPKGSGAAPALSKGFNAGPHLKPVARRPMEDTGGATIEVPKVVKSTPFSKRQRQRLLELRSMLLDSMESVADGSLRSRPEGSEASAFGQHMADAGSDAYDRDFALSLLSQEQDALYEINEALKRVDIGTYGICEMSGKPIPEIRLEALPFTRFTVECQAQLEREGMGGRHRRPVRSLFGLEGESEGDSDGDDEEETETVDNKQE
ncbi:MAG: yocK [Verrucomicrobiaceae bacterium]|nr:yocK [Verrucomicrobiaceae bacterium]